MKKRFTDCEKWAKQWFRRLPPDWKCAWQYLLDHCDPAGVIRVDEELANFQIGAEIDWEKFLSACGERVRKLDDGKIFVVGFVLFQYGNRISRQASPHLPVIKAIEYYGLEETLENFGVLISDGWNSHKTVRKRITQKFKEELYSLDAFTCQYCGQEKPPSELQPDHVVPVSKGGQHSIDNLVTSCVSCNAKKRDIDAIEFVKRYNLTPLERVSNILKTLKDKDKDKDKETIKGGVGETASDSWEIPEHLDTPKVREELEAFARMRSKIRKPIKDYRNTSRVFKKFSSVDDLLFVLDLCIANEWQGIDTKYLERRKPVNGQSGFLTPARQREENMRQTRQRILEMEQAAGGQFPLIGERK